MNSFLFYVDQFQSVITTALDEATQFSDSCPSRLKEAVRYSLLAGGKRLRPLLTLLSCQACGGKVEQALPAAVAIEMIHTYSLIHDDLPAMDDDDLRRGRPTNHRQFDEATAILAGDGLLTYAFEVLAAQIPQPELAIRCCLELARAAGVNGMVGGQQADMEAEKRDVNGEHRTSDHELTLLKAIHRRKTGRLITCAARMGAILASSSEEQLDAVTKYGDAIGLAFQITDDLLDCTSTAEKMGKGVGKDTQHDKLTYPGLLGLAESQQQAELLIDEAQAALAMMGSSADGLRAVAMYIIERDR